MMYIIFRNANNSDVISFHFPFRFRHNPFSHCFAFSVAFHIVWRRCVYLTIFPTNINVYRFSFAVLPFCRFAFAASSSFMQSDELKWREMECKISFRTNALFHLRRWQEGIIFLYRFKWVSWFFPLSNRFSWTSEGDSGKSSWIIKW